MGAIDKNFWSEGFTVTYDDGVRERFHKNILNDNYKGDKGSTVEDHILDDGFTVRRYDGTTEKFYKNVMSDGFTGSSGTRIDKSFFGSSFSTNNPYADCLYKVPTTFAEARKAKYQETALRLYELDYNAEEVDNEQIKNALQEVIDAADLPLFAVESDVIGCEAVAIVSKENKSYMPVFTYLTDGNGAGAVVSSVQGKGEQTKSSDLEKLFYKAQSPLGKFTINMEKGRAWSQFLGHSMRAGGIVGGAAALTGAAIGKTFRMAAAGIKILFRDNDAYKKEMEFYEQALGVIDFAVGYVDSADLLSRIKEKAAGGISLAQYYMGLACTYGIGIDQDEKAAFEWYEKAADNGELRSQNIAAGEYLYNLDKSYSIEKKEKAIGYLYNLASFGEDWAGELIIDIYGRGSVADIPVNYGEAVRVAEIYALERNMHAVEFLIQIYDTGLDSSPVSQSYKNDKRAFDLYNVILEDGSRDDKENAAMKLADMCMKGRGAEKNLISALEYYKIAEKYGNVHAAAVLLYFCTNDGSTMKSAEAARYYANQIIKQKKEEYIPAAYYSLFKFADEEKEYAESMKWARLYLECRYAEPEKKEQLQKYLGDMETKISQMTDEERRAFLKEPEKFTINSKIVKWILAGCAVVIAVILAFTMCSHFKDSNADDGYISSSDNIHKEAAEENTSEFSDEARQAISAYNDFLTQESFNRGSEELPQIWYMENCEFNLAYIDDNDIPELLLYNTTDADHTTGWGEIYTYTDGAIEECGATNSLAENIGYYERSGYYMNFAMWQGYGGIAISKCSNSQDSESGTEFRIEFYADEDGKHTISGYFVDGNECSESDFSSELEKRTGGAELIQYTYYDNTYENREKILGIE